MVKKYKYKISVVVPIYNVEEYLEETIKSVINQTIGFKKNIQLIFVNDGSPDNSEAICLKYKEKYPDNVIYIKQKNQWLSAARNNGFKHALGKYVNFLDSDDKLEKACYEKAYKMLEKHEEIDFVAFRIKYFDDKKGYHFTDFKYTGDKIIDINKDYKCLHMHNTSTVIRSEVMRKIEFDSNLKFAEDVKAMYEIVFQKLKYGIISSSNYLYRVRKNGTSIMQTTGKKSMYYNDTLEQRHKYLCNLSIKTFGKVIPYVQSYILYDFKWRLTYDNVFAPLSKKEIKQYLTNLYDLVKLCDNEIIIKQDVNLNIILKELEIKNGKQKLSIKDGHLLFGDILVRDIKSLSLDIEILEAKNNELVIAGLIPFFEGDKIDLLLKRNNKAQEKVKLFERVYANQKYIDGASTNIYGFDVKFKLNEIENLSFYLKADKEIIKIPLNFKKFSKLTNSRKSYYKINDHIITWKNNQVIIKKSLKIIEPLKKELTYLLALVVNRKIKVALTRIIYYLTKPFFFKKNIWLISDRYDLAGDNGESLFTYINQQRKNEKVQAYFLLSKGSRDLEKMKRVGKIIINKSIKHKIYFLHAKCIISSHADYFVTNIFGKSQTYYNDLLKFRFVFLGHGITYNDLSDWLNKYDKNIDLFITAAKEEYDALLKLDYYYDASIVKLTGLPRYDKLLKKDATLENRILLAPTWRKDLAGAPVKGTQFRKYEPSFIDTEYYKFYNGLLTDPRVLKVLKAKKYTINFFLHPNLKAQLKDFKKAKSELINICIDANYAHEFKISKLMITDYSSVFFDFAYLKKPLIYSQFDERTFNEEHWTKGYFDYHKDAFGEVCTKYEETIKTIVKCIENDCQMAENYQKKVDDFFAFRDDRNCQRVYDAIIDLDK